MGLQFGLITEMFPAFVWAVLGSGLDRAGAVRFRPIPLVLTAFVGHSSILLERHSPILLLNFPLSG